MPPSLKDDGFQLLHRHASVPDPDESQSSSNRRDSIQPPAVTPSDDAEALRARCIRNRLHGLGYLAAGIAHELRNPLSTLGTSVYYLSQVLETQGNKAIREHLEIMQSEIERSQRVISNLVDFSLRSGDGRQKADTNHLLEQTISVLGENLQRQNIAVQKRLAPLPPCFVCVDDIKQVFMQLLLNAIEAMPGGGELSIESRLQDKQTAGYRIIDSGAGIVEDRLDQIFYPFYTSDKNESVGMGLSLVHACLERNGGRIAVKSTVGLGTECAIFLPIHGKGHVG